MYNIFLRPLSILFSLLLIYQVALSQNFSRQRQIMVSSQIKARGISDQNTIRAMGNVPRHLYIPYNQRNSAYEDRPLPIGYGQTISQPYIVAYMTEIVNPKGDQKVLEIGTGSGYQAAVLAEIVDHVYTIEIVRPLGETAKTALLQNYNNVSVKVGDGYYGWEEHAPFDAIVVTAAAEYIPPPLIEQLKEGGRMVIPVGSPFRVQQLMLIEKKNGQISSRSLMPVRFVPFTSSESN